MRFLLLTGMSGAGKSAALRYFEDIGAFCVDNLPPMMLLPLMDAVGKADIHKNLAAFSVDVRSGAFFDAEALVKLIKELRGLGHTVETLYLEASDEELLIRYKETRRDHPLASRHVTLVEAIARERTVLTPLRETADYLIDTTGMKTRAFQKRLGQIAGSDGKTAETVFRVEVLSFGFKRGLPRQADLVLDVRFLPNPFYIPELCRHTGLDEDVRAFVMDNPVTKQFMEKVCDLLAFLVPHYREEGKHRLTIAVGCTGGAHRSVAIAEAVGAFLRTAGCEAEVLHRDRELEQARWEAGSQEEE